MFSVVAAGHVGCVRTIPGELTPALLREGYALLPNRRRQLGEDAFRARLLGERVVCVLGPEATRRFYDEDLFVRAGTLPRPVRRTLTGEHGVQMLDGAAHRNRKTMFTSRLRDPAEVEALCARTVGCWDGAVASWSRTPQIVLFDEAAEVLMQAVCDWVGVSAGAASLRAADMVAMVDGFGGVGRRHLRARRARRRSERASRTVVQRVRDETLTAPRGSVLERIAWHRDADGRQLTPEVAAVELLNVIRPTVAIAWFVAFAAHALHRWPAYRPRLEEADAAFAVAFAHEVRRFYPFGPFVGARARRDLSWDGEVITAGTLVLLDLFGQDHHPDLWEEPWTFRPERFLPRAPSELDLVPQGGGDVETGHRCAGEDIVVALLTVLLPRLARLRYDVPPQDLSIPLARVPTRPRSGVVLAGVRPPG